jgi:phosphopantothenate synthetase
VTESNGEIEEGDVIEFTLRGERRTAEAMLITEDDVVLLDLFDGDRPAWARLSILAEVAVFRPDTNHVVSAA